MADLSLAELESFDPNAKGRGRERRFCCPLCNGDRTKNQDHRSLALNVDSGAWRCHRCEASGLLLDNRQDHRSMTVKKRSPWDGVKVKTPEPEPNSPPKKLFQWAIDGLAPIIGTAGAEYLERRGIPAGAAAASKVKFSPRFLGAFADFLAGKGESPGFQIEPAVVFPLYSADGSRLMGVQARSIMSSQKLTINAKEGAGRGIFATPGAWDGTPTITEAPIDALSLAVAGTPAIATNGTAAPPTLIESIFCRPVVLAQDADEPDARGVRAGDVAAIKLAELLAPRGGLCSRLRPPEGFKDWNAALVSMGAENLRRWLAGSPPIANEKPAPEQPISCDLVYDSSMGELSFPTPRAVMIAGRVRDDILCVNPDIEKAWKWRDRFEQ